MKEEDLRSQINELIKDEIQEVINDYVEEKEKEVFRMESTGLGFVNAEEDDELKVKVSSREIDKIIKEYKKIKKSQRSNLAHIKKMGLVDKNGKSLS